MEPIRVVWGTATGPTEMASYDAALAAAGVENYNLVSVSSVAPPDATVDAVGTAPDLGETGGRLTVVEARETAVGPTHVSAGLGWVQSEGAGGLFYEAAGETSAAETRRRVEEGLTAGMALREWSFGEPTTRVVDASADADAYTTALVLAVYGDADPLL
jgi:arginine decarboxylase